MNIHRLTIENLKHIIETLADSNDDVQIALHMAATKELDRRLKLFNKGA